VINKSRLLQTLCELIEIDSPSGDEETVALKLKEIMIGLGVDADLDSYGNLVGRFGSGNPILLSAHMDTVEPGRGIKPKVDGDRVISGGTTILGGDCKAGIAAIIEGITSLSEEGISPKPFEIAFTRQEEIGLLGARNLDVSRFMSKEAIVFDGEGPVTQITSSSLP
jgi:tripeptide aminopeptidase